MSPARRFFRILVWAAVWASMLACAPALQQTRPPLAGRPSEVVGFFTSLDAAVKQHGVRDASAFAVEGFPYLRINRFWGYLAGRDLESNALGHRIVASMRDLDRVGRRQEIRNLPDAAVAAITGIADPEDARGALVRQAETAAVRLEHYDRSQPGYTEALRSAARAPSEYSTAMRIFGLYPLFVVPFGIGTEHAYFRFRQWHAAAPEELPVDGTLTTFVYQNAAGSSRNTALQMLRDRPADAFGFPELSPQQETRLIEAFAPVIVQDVAADHDRPGTVQWRDEKVSVETGAPVVYHYITRAYMGNDPVLQLNYAFWYTARAGRRPPSYEKGPLDGITVRINLDPSGRADLVDIMNNCGCYYLIVPRRDRIEKVTPTFSGLYPFVPAYLPEEFPDRPLTLRIISGWHQVERVSAAAPPDTPSATYRLLPYDRLESLPRADGSRASVFTAQGIMKDSERIEPYIFFSMGIPKIGYMRQRGHHAVELVGRAHFSDPDIYNRYFVFRP